MKKQRRNQQKNQKLYIGIAILIAVFAIGAIAFATGNDSSSNSATSQLISPANYQQEFTSKQHVLLDVRTPEEFATGHIPGAVNISVETLASHLDEVPTDQPVVVYCRSGNRSAQAADILTSAGYKSVYDLGGILTWSAQGYPVE